ncbi:Trk-type pottasium transport system, NAD-binding component [Thermococcus onnurineus NA1]|uniref:Trk-type pottasium transport system, NAD-binding component n=1 Tax=Thermococcus onnurineus (strain NA1) TaxID=523850 RepID=B6YV07_THEON|nr:MULTISPECIES: TrkA family potassium uptake protein [Thermococcus]ACJ17235.1 Trk-type pottasium transport system, NAD-binding component [Thermococcus onnurineus NA1]NJE46022.1 TrkA family potassium uptake protein [Thermococcus sp. GR7]NJE78516.1 TrkA family potassium uptake protein [Thermococcus sp. GR4]NJF22219.1 TrkA family potassium uptake protein [Thermococcus sp. GR5]
MFVVIMGAGRVGYLVAKMLEEEGHDVTIIEMDKERAKELSLLINGLVIEGDATDPKTLEEANIKQADAFAALTGKDDANLLACILAKHLNPKIKTSLRIGNPKNRRIFEEVTDLKRYFDFVISPEEIAAEYISRNIVTPGFDRVLFPKEGAEIVRFTIEKGSEIAGKLVKDLNIPKDALIIAIYDEKGNLMIPSGDTKLPERGQVIVFAKSSVLDDVKELLEKKSTEKLE